VVETQKKKSSTYGQELLTLRIAVDSVVPSLFGLLGVNLNLSVLRGVVQVGKEGLNDALSGLNISRLADKVLLQAYELDILAECVLAHAIVVEVVLIIVNLTK
jgi:hypothetical protein